MRPGRCEGNASPGRMQPRHACDRGPTTQHPDRPCSLVQDLYGLCCDTLLILTDMPAEGPEAVSVSSLLLCRAPWTLIVQQAGRSPMPMPMRTHQNTP